MTPTTPRRRVKFKQRTPRSTHGNSRRTQRALVAALLAVGLGAPASFLVRAIVRDGLADPAGVARRFQLGVPVNEPLLRLPSAPPVAVAPAPARDVAARPAAGWSTPAPDAAVSRSWETPFANGRTVAVAPVVPVAAPAVRAALNARDAGFAPAPFGGLVRGVGFAPAAPGGLHGLAAPALASLVAASGVVESAPAGRPGPEGSAHLTAGPRARLAVSNAVIPVNPTFTWSGLAVSSGSPPSPNWNVGNNWVGSTAPGTGANANIIYAPAPASATATNVEQVYTINSLAFLAAAPSYNVTQNAFSYLSVGAGGITDASANAQTLSTEIYASAADNTITVSDPNGRLNLPGAVFNPSQSPAVTTALYLQGANRVVTVDGPGTTNITGVVTQGGVATSGALVKNGVGTLILAGNNLYTGGTTLNAGTIDVRNNNALGTGTFTVNNSVTLANNAVASPSPFPQSVTLPNAVTLNGNLSHGASNDSLTFSGPVTLAAGNHTVSSTNTDFDSVTFSGVISGAAASSGLTFGPSATDAFYLTGAAPNTYAGTTVVDNAGLYLQKDSGNVAIPGNLTIQNNSYVATDGGQLGAAITLTVNTGGQFDASGGFVASANETIATLNGDSTGTVSFGNQFLATRLTVNQGTFNGLLQDGRLIEERAPGARNALAAAASSPFDTTGGQLNKASAGPLTLTHNNTYSGGTLVTAGALFANNVPSSSPALLSGDSATGSGAVLVLDGARLGGSGSVGAGKYSYNNGESTVNVPATTVTIGGTLGTPGLAGGAVPNLIANPAILGAGATLNSTAVLTVNGNLTLTSTAVLETELGGTTAGAGYDQVRVGGAIALGGNLSLATVNGFALSVGQTFYILDGVSADAVIAGVFANVTPATATTGTFTDAQGDIFSVNYADTDPLDTSKTAGNDISVTVLAVPEPGSLALAAAGMSAALGAWVRRRRAA